MPVIVSQLMTINCITVTSVLNMCKNKQHFTVKLQLISDSPFNLSFKTSLVCLKYFTIIYYICLTKYIVVNALDDST